MIQNKRGLSAVITTLIIILLVIVSIGIFWNVAQGIFERSTEQIDIGTKCLDVDLSVSKVINTSQENYDVTLATGSRGEAIDGVKITLFNDTTNSAVLNFGSRIDPLGTVTQSVSNTGVSNANKIETTPYFLDETGKEELCPQKKSSEI